MNVKFDGKDKLIITLSDGSDSLKEKEAEIIKDIDWIDLFQNITDDFSTNWKTYVQDKEFISALEYYIHLEMLGSAFSSFLS